MTANIVRRVRIDPQTRLGAVRLTVRDVGAMTEFYERTVGLRVLSREDDAVLLGVDDGAPLVELRHRPGAVPRPSGTTGLFHLALLVPGRPVLAEAIRRVTERGRQFTGASDHLVSEAVYLRDPEGNGIEIYRDRDPDEWEWDDASVQMATLPLAIESVMSELPERPEPLMPAGTVLGHVHLNVADLAATEAFYADMLGFDVTTRAYPGALFLSAGGYHHHLGANLWGGAGAPAPPAGAMGLDAFEVVLQHTGALDQVLAAVADAGVPTVEDAAGTALSDPSGNRLILRTR
jgi:catechol 2,3-dioxygenase